MTLEIGLLLALTAACVVLFAIEWIPPDVTALMVVLALVLLKLVKPSAAFQGFGSDIVITMLGLLILTAALLRTGVVDLVGSGILSFTGTDPTRLLVVIMVACAVMSAFMSNTASAAFFVPIVMGLSRRAQISPTQLLLPLAFASILTSSVTLISTSTNIVVDGLMKRDGLEPMGMFELAPVGIPIAVAGLIYMTVVSRFTLGRASRRAAASSLRPYLSQAVVLPGSKLIGQTPALAAGGGFAIVHVVRGDERSPLTDDDTVIQAGDRLLIEASPGELLRLAGADDLAFDLEGGSLDPADALDDRGIVEVILPWHSPLLGRTLRTIAPRERFGVHVIGVGRRGKIRRQSLADVRLHVGNVLLIHGPREVIAALQEDGTFSLIRTLDDQHPRHRRAPLAIVIFVGVLVLVTFKVLPFAVAVMLGAVVMFLTRCITPEEAYREVEWRILILIGSMLALGVAMDETGTARYLAAMLAGGIGDHPLWLLAGFFALTVLLTQPMSNQAAAVVVMPVALQTAHQLGLNPRTFAMMIAVAASCSYLTPLEPSCLMVYGPGGYKFSDFLKVGSVLTLIIGAIAMLLVPIVWPVR
jgi:di/tricarboxylate transporter